MYWIQYNIDKGKKLSSVTQLAFLMSMFLTKTFKIKILRLSTIKLSTMGCLSAFVHFYKPYSSSSTTTTTKKNKKKKKNLRGDTSCLSNYQQWGV